MYHKILGEEGEFVKFRESFEKKSLIVMEEERNEEKSKEKEEEEGEREEGRRKGEEQKGRGGEEMEKALREK